MRHSGQARGAKWLVGAGALLSVSVARADAPHHFLVRWSTNDGAQSCGQEAELLARVRELVSPELLSTPEMADRVITGTASWEEGAWRALLRVSDAAGESLGERELRSDAASCRELDESVALAIALIIDPNKGFASGSPAPEVSAASPAPTAADAPPIASKPASSALQREAAAPEQNSEPDLAPITRPLVARRTRLLKAEAVLLSGILPAPALGVQIELWYPTVGSDALRLGLAYFGAQTASVPGRADVGTTVHVGTARLGYCPLLATGPSLYVYGCAGFEAGVMAAHGFGGGYNQSPLRALVALDGAVSVDRALSKRWAATVTAGASATPYRPSFAYRTAAGSEETLARRGALEGRLEIGLALRF